jgi:XTP/dITP diphosphohydrolase
VRIDLAGQTVVLATRNAGKLREFAELLAPASWNLIGLADAGVTGEPEETGATFAENARLKATAYSLLTPLPVLSDDSGLEVFGLDGRPGVQSARYAGLGASDGERNAKLLAELRDSGAPREARFACSLALAHRGNLLAEAEGECGGVIAESPRGTGGVGYDPLFLVPGLGRTYAELTPDEKNALSHRARAVAALLRCLLLNN